ncbi:hypothetical protein [Ottowia caeni]|uniref:hypothetical protein n=1 Tax=Ottowia caeni TaxID=2870339 RepID=UPI003D75951A
MTTNSNSLPGDLQSAVGWGIRPDIDNTHQSPAVEIMDLLPEERMHDHRPAVRR